jgi:branched-chain amino acid transport system ATP-binding protein
VPTAQGKTTTLALALGHVPTSGGEIRYDGKPIGGRSHLKTSCGSASHTCRRAAAPSRAQTWRESQIGAMTALRPRRRSRPTSSAVYGYFPRLKERRTQQAGTLSGGEQQMLAVGRAMMLRPRLMLLDEPSFGLAPLIVEELFGILGTLNKKEKVSMLLVEQNAALALDLADHAYLIETGRLVMEGPAQKLRDDENIRKAYLGY